MTKLNSQPVRLSADLLAKVKELAEKEHRSIPMQVEWLLMKALATHKP